MVQIARRRGFAALPGFLLWASTAGAVQQPDGLMIPVILSAGGACNSGLNVQACLDDSEVSLGGAAGAVGAIANATINQETFDPSCQLTFKVLSKGGSRYPHVFGWYVARPGNVPPALSDLNAFLTCMDTQTPGTMKTLTLPPGVGKIGFFMASYSSTCGTVAANGTLASEPLYTFYTEQRFNGLDRRGMAIPGVPAKVIRVLTWQSAAQPGAFYFGWEDDGISSDNNFNDLVTRVGGISCSGGGGSCDTGQKGACARGTMQCRGGMLTCVPEQGPAAETCNAVDDNCDGTIDEGDKLCPALLVCHRGNCVPGCLDVEVYHCADGFECDRAAAPNGICVETSCKTVTCPEGQLCRGGQCRGECEGIVCPYGQACRHGGCVDVCAGLKCDTGARCLVGYPGGDAQPPVGVCSVCPCGGCPTGTTCTDNACVPTACAAVSCAPGTHCQAGNCIDSCAGAKCPAGSSCKQGQCTPDGSTGAGGGKDGGGGGDAGAAPMMPPPRDAAGDASDAGTPWASRNVGCGCRFDDAGTGGAAALALAGAIAMLRSRRRARRQR